MVSDINKTTATQVLRLGAVDENVFTIYGKGDF